MARAVLLAVAVCVASGCYYLEAGGGQLSLINRQEPLPHAIARESDPARRALLSSVPHVLAYARDVMHMEAGQSYRGYVNIPDRGLTFVLMAAEKTRLQPYRWWFPFAGEVEYKSFFNLEHAEAEAAELAKEGYDVFIGRSRAYSTLGYLRDPIVSTMLDEGAVGFVEVLFHELAHRRLYVPGQTAFNERLASFVAQQGCQRFFAQPRFARSDLAQQWSERRERDKLRQELVEATVATLTQLYDSSLPERVKLERRQKLFAKLSRELAAIDPTTRPENEIINNARLLQFVRYGDDDPHLEQLWHTCQQDFRCFWAAVEQYAKTGLTEDNHK